ncbi:MAG: helix-turn-helix transcriptional regulator [Legionellales bacterium]|nr:helix-turn-helix transcriptional regulator [Legionellales bacterium]
MSKKALNHENLKKELLKDPSISKKYADLEEEFQLIHEMLKARKKARLTQEKIAESMHTTKSAISRLESLYLEDAPSPSFATLKKYAHAVDCKLSIKLIANKK